MAAAAKAIQVQTNVNKNGRRVRSIALIVASGMVFAGCVRAAEPPEGFLRKIAEREAQNSKARDNYTYRQSVTVQEFSVHGQVVGEYHEVRDITFSPTRTRSETVVQPGKSTLTRIRLTQEDFNDIRNIQPFLLTPDKISLYEGRYQGEQTMDGTQCFVEYVRPKQILSGQRFFEGTLWVRESDYAVVRSEGQAVPQIENTKEQNLTPHFTTVRREIDGKWFFPVETYADDTLYFRDFPQRIRTIVRYMNYRRFEADSSVSFGEPDPPAPPPH